MSELSKRATVYFDPALHRALRVRAACRLGSAALILAACHPLQCGAGKLLATKIARCRSD